VTRRRAVVLASAAALAAAAGFGLWQWATWPDVAALRGANPSTTAFAASAGVTLRWTPYAAISDELKIAVLVAEDIEFFSHSGFSRAEMEEALRETIEEGRPLRGASTLTQQLAKNLWLSSARTPWRKAKEALLTRSLERHLGKRRILELYLNVAEFGPGIYGVGHAAGAYFAKAAAELDAHEAAQLAAGLSRPAQWNPRSKSSSYARRVSAIERRAELAREWISRSL
jgi:monofunctional biosynthetic peptidoglycan transglycosylase